MAILNIANREGLDAQVQAQPTRRPTRIRWMDGQGRQATGARLLRATLDRDAAVLAEQAGGMEKLSEVLTHADPEVDPETFGRVLRETSRVFVDPDGRIVHHVQQVEVLRNPDGTERERRPRKAVTANINVPGEPIRFSNRRFKKSEVYNRFVFSRKRQLVHVSGLTYQFLYNIAKELEEQDCLLLVGSGPRGQNPIYFSRNGAPYRGFLEGRTQGDRYCLILYLSKMELKAPAAGESAP